MLNYQEYISEGIFQKIGKKLTKTANEIKIENICKTYRIQNYKINQDFFLYSV